MTAPDVASEPREHLWPLRSPSRRSVRRTLDRAGVPYRRCSSSKVAFRTALAALDLAGSNVLLPAYLPPGIVEPLREFDLEPRYYGIGPDLTLDVADAEARVDDETAAVMVVHYFGFPQPSFEAFADLAERHDLALVDNASHSVLSRHEGRLLGTRGDVGFSSLHKTLPIPDGAVLYFNGPRVDPATRYPLMGTRERYTAADVRHVAGVLAARTGRLGAAVDSLAKAASNGGAPAAPPSADPVGEYQGVKRRLSRLSALALTRIDAVDVVATRRAVFARWLHHLAPDDRFTPVFERLPAGVCPWYFPVRAADPGAVVDALSEFVTVFTWPTLPADVSRAFRVEHDLADSLVVLPVNQDMTPADVDALAARLP
ncbi:DegT/DnrJ/EryC1/StrS family aminotransferase [Halomarina ordinaria]|uniref:DegT/DnrJ/EryC1/StrS family aminotransferase n=1 Tax=Halomarina ordinaria TaxID=3033939 RepID=A0ABD5UD29_9EURY|nr:DegT/DnrJ/EryC1/StrS family aminotransferase [Halomarina sp. PSRA2]